MNGRASWCACSASSTVAEIASRTIWFATGNNLQIVDDLTRRCLVAHLDTGLEEPERKQFNGNPLATIMRERGRYVAACPYRTSRLSRRRLAPLACRASQATSFGATSCPSALVWCGYADPLNTMRSARADDPSFQYRNAVFAAWPPLSDNEDSALTTAELVERAEMDTDPALKEALLAVAPGGPQGKVDGTKLGKWLADNKNRLANGCQLAKAKPKSGRARWFVRRTRTG